MKNKTKIKTQTKKLLAQILIASTFFLGLIYVCEQSIIKLTGFWTDFLVMQTDGFGITVPEAKAEDPTIKDWSVQDKIVYYADIYGVDKDTALRIAKCESGFNPRAENINGSATGVYQFIRKTWSKYCEGDVYNADANIICFVRMYPQNPDWWECK